MAVSFVAVDGRAALCVIVVCATWCLLMLHLTSFPLAFNFRVFGITCRVNCLVNVVGACSIQAFAIENACGVVFFMNPFSCSAPCHLCC